MVDPAVADSTVQPSAHLRAGLSWRHFAAVLLLLVTCPIFLVAAMLAAPVLLLFVCIDGVRKVFELTPLLGDAPSH
jgi:hypothetical protein